MNLRKDHYRESVACGGSVLNPGWERGARAPLPPFSLAPSVGRGSGVALSCPQGSGASALRPEPAMATRLRFLSAGCDRPRREAPVGTITLRPRRPARVASRVSTTRRVPPERGGGLNVPGAGLGPRSRGARRSLPLVKNPFKYLMNALAVPKQN